MILGHSLRLRFGVLLAIGLFVNGTSVPAQGLFSSTLAPAKKPEPPIQPAGTPTTSTEVVDGKNQMAILQSNSAKLLQDATAKYAAIIGQGGFPRISSGNYKKGDKNAAVATLNKRLFVEGYLRVEGTQGQFADVFTSATDDALRRFQRNHGLLANGKVDPATLAELNIPVEKRLATISANIPRLEVYEQGLGDRYVVVNIPAQQLEAVSGGRVYERHNVIVGRPARPTPVVMTPLATVRFNPYWNAPVSIVERDILPKLQSGTEYLKQTNIKILEGGPNGREVDPKTLNFRTLVPDNYLFREEPGPANAMATAKIEFQSPFGIYLHDTPDKPMFNFNNRFFSSGCIRVQNMPQLVNWVMNGQDGVNAEAIAGLAKSLQRVDETLTNPPQLRVAYLTAWPSAGGTVSFRNDIYQMDGSGFTVGQPMPVGEMSPDGKRFVLKPLPRAVSVDAAEADGSGFFGFHKTVADTGKGASLFAPSTKFKQNVSVAAATITSGKTGGFNWPAYYKKRDAAAKAAALKELKGAKAKAATKKISDKKVVAKKTAEKPVRTVVKTSIKKKLDCKPAADGSVKEGCKL